MIKGFKTVKSSSNLVTPDKDKLYYYLEEKYKGVNLIDLLEKRLAETHEVSYCVTFPNCFSSIIACFSALALDKSKEIITPSFSYRRFGDIVSWSGFVPYFCDVQEETLVPSVQQLENCITKNTAAILLVHPMILVQDFSEHEAFADKIGIPLIIDSVEAPLSKINARSVGSFGSAECFSMHASKLINACDGGYTTTNDEKLCSKLKSVRSEISLGLHELHCLFALASLDNIGPQIERNKKKYFTYNHLLSDTKGISLVKYDENETRGFKNILVKLNSRWPLSREETITILNSKNILARPFWFPPIHFNKSTYPAKWKNLNNTEKLTKEFMLLPCGEFVSLDDIKRICDVLNTLSEAIEDNKTLALPATEAPFTNSFGENSFFEKYKQQNIEDLRKKDVQSLFDSILETKWYTSQGPLLTELENHLSQKYKCKDAICVLSHSWAIMIALKSFWNKAVFFQNKQDKFQKKIFDFINFNNKYITKDINSAEVIISFNGFQTNKDNEISFISLGTESSVFCILTRNKEFSSIIRNTRTVPGRRDKRDVYSIGNGRVSEVQAGLAIIQLKEEK